VRLCLQKEMLGDVFRSMLLAPSPSGMHVLP